MKAHELFIFHECVQLAEREKGGKEGRGKGKGHGGEVRGEDSLFLYTRFVNITF